MSRYSGKQAHRVLGLEGGVCTISARTAGGRLKKRFVHSACLVILLLLSSCSDDSEVFIVGQERFCVPKANVMQANVAWLPDSVPKSGGFNFQSKAQTIASSEIMGSVMPKGHYGAFPKPATDSIHVAELRAANDESYTTTGDYVVVGNPSESLFVRIWERKTFDAARSSRFASAPELIASCQRYEIVSNPAQSLVCERAIRQANYDVAFSFSFTDLNSLPLIEKNVRELMADWQCTAR